MSDSGSGRRGSRSRKAAQNLGQEGSSPLEWLTAALGAVLVLGTVGIMLYGALRNSPAPPQIEIAVDQIVETGSGYVVTFTARNRGSTTAAGLVVEGTLRGENGEVEQSTVTITYVPSEAREKAGLYFTQDPRRYRLELRPLGYEQP